MRNPLLFLRDVLRAILTPNVATSEPNSTSGRVPLWWTMLIAAASVYATATFGAPICGGS